MKILTKVLLKLFSSFLKHFLYISLIFYWLKLLKFGTLLPLTYDIRFYYLSQHFQNKIGMKQLLLVKFSGHVYEQCIIQVSVYNIYPKKEKKKHIGNLLWGFQVLLCKQMKCNTNFYFLNKSQNHRPWKHLVNTISHIHE